MNFNRECGHLGEAEVESGHEFFFSPRIIGPLTQIFTRRYQSQRGKVIFFKSRFQGVFQLEHPLVVFADWLAILRLVLPAAVDVS